MEWCPRCHEYGMYQEAADNGDKECLICGYVQYSLAPLKLVANRGKRNQRIKYEKKDKERRYG